MDWVHHTSTPVGQTEAKGSFCAPGCKHITEPVRVTSPMSLSDDMPQATKT
jgi:hypothetical protein